MVEINQREVLKLGMKATWKSVSAYGAFLLVGQGKRNQKSGSPNYTVYFQKEDSRPPEQLEEKGEVSQQPSEGNIH